VAWEHNLEGMSGASRELNDALFKFNGTQYVTRVTRMAALRMAHDRLVELTKTDTKAANDELAMFGVKRSDLTVGADGNIVMLSPDRIAELEAKVAAEYDAKVNNPNAQHTLNHKITADPELAKTLRIQAAMTRMVNRSVQKPSPAMIPMGASYQHPVAMLAYHLQRFMYAFWENFTMPLVHRMANVTPESQKSSTIAFALRMSSFIGLYMFTEILRDLIQHTGDDDPAKRGFDLGDWIAYSFVGSGILGPTEVAMRVNRETEQGHMPIEAIIGPTGQGAADILRSMGGDSEQRHDLLWRMAPFQNVLRWWLKD
jgi:hypothetical protein